MKENKRAIWVEILADSKGLQRELLKVRQKIKNFYKSTPQMSEKLNVGKVLQKGKTPLGPAQDSKKFLRDNRESFSQLGEYSSSLNNKLQQTKGFINSVKDVATRMQEPISKNVNAYKQIGSAVTGAQKEQTKYWNNYFKGMDGVSKVTNKTARQVMMSWKKIPFQGWALSIMFFGMAIKRVFDSILKKSTSVFQDVSHSVEGTATVFDILDGSIKGVWYTLGAAISSVIEPLLPYLLIIINKITTWVSENERLAGWIVILGLVLGTFMMILGMVVLGVVGVMMAFGILAEYLTVAFVASLLSFIGWVALIAAAFYLLWVTNLGNFQDFFTETFGILWDTVKAVFEHIWGFVSNVWKGIVAILKGDWDNGMKYLGEAMKHLLALLYKLWIGLSAALANIAIFTWNSIVQIAINVLLGGMVWITKKLDELFMELLVGIVGYFQDAFQKVVDFVNKIISRLNRVQGITITPIADVDLSFIQKAIKNMGDKRQDFLDGILESGKEASKEFTWDYISREQISQMFGGVDKLLGLTDDATSQELSIEDEDTKKNEEKQVSLLEQIKKSLDDKQPITINNVELKTDDMEDLLDQLKSFQRV